jgi:hypothetical protein
MCDKKKDLLAPDTGVITKSPTTVKPSQAAISHAIAPIPAVTDINADALRAATSTSRHTALPVRPPIYGPLPAPWTVTIPTLVPILPMVEVPILPIVEDDDAGSDYSDNDTDCDEASSDGGDGDDDDDGGGDGDGEDGNDDDDDDTDGHIINVLPPQSKRTRRTC